MAVDPRIQARRDQVVSERIRRRRQRSVVVAALVAVVALGWLVTHSSLLAVHRLVITASPHVPDRRGGPGRRGSGSASTSSTWTTRRRGPASCACPGWPRPGSTWAGTAWPTWRSPNARRSLAVADGPRVGCWPTPTAGRWRWSTPCPPAWWRCPVWPRCPRAPPSGRPWTPRWRVVAHLTPGLRTRVGAGGITVAADGSLADGPAAQRHAPAVPAGRSGHQAERA